MSPKESNKNESNKRVIVPLRHYGRFVAAVVVLFLLGAILLSVARNDKVKWGEVGHIVWSINTLKGVWVTVLLTTIAMVAGLFLGTLSATAGLSKNPVLRAVSLGFTWFFRGTPLLVQILFWFNLALFFPFIGPWDTNRLISSFTAAALALSLNEGAYMSEIVRTGIQAIDHGQTEASQSLGLSPIQTLRKVVLPQAMRIIIPPTGNETISMLKSTSLVYVIGSVYDLLTRLQIAYKPKFLIIEYLFGASVWYLILTSVLSVGQHFIEKRFGRGFDGGKSGGKSGGNRMLRFGKAAS
jgi:polar amino acid transport system permease protein